MKLVSKIAIALMVSSIVISAGETCSSFIEQGLSLGVVSQPEMPILNSANQSMLPTWIYQNGRQFWRVSISEDGNYFAAGTFDEHGLYLFNRSNLLWNYSIGSMIQSISMSGDGRYVAVAAGHFYFFDRESTSPLQTCENCSIDKVVTSYDGTYSVGMGGDSSYHQGGQKVVYVFEKGVPEPLWTKALPGCAGCISISRDGAYFVVQTAIPGAIYVFSIGQETPLWTRSLGYYDGGAVISGDGNWIFAAAFVDGSGSDNYVYRFSRTGPVPVWSYALGTMTSRGMISASYNGSILVLSPFNENKLILFDNNQLRQMITPAGVRGYLAISMGGRYIFVGSYSSAGVFGFEYSSNQLGTASNCTINTPYISGICCSANGNQLAVAGSWSEGSETRSAVYFFDNLHQDNPDIPEYYSSLTAVLVTILLSTLMATCIRFKRRRTEAQENRPEPDHSIEVSCAALRARVKRADLSGICSRSLFFSDRILF